MTNSTHFLHWFCISDFPMMISSGHGVWMSQKKSQTTFNVYILNGLKMPKIGNLASFWKPEVWGETGLPDRSILIGQKLVEWNMPKLKNSNGTFWAFFKQCEVFQPRNHWRKNLAWMRSKRENALITATKQLCVVTFELSEHSRNALQGVLAHHHYCNHRHHPFKMLTERNKSNLDFPFSHSVTFMVRKQYDQNNYFGIFRYAGIFRF